jgi:hypothetical protein
MFSGRQVAAVRATDATRKNVADFRLRPFSLRKHRLARGERASVTQSEVLRPLHLVGDSQPPVLRAATSMRQVVFRIRWRAEAIPNLLAPCAHRSDSMKQANGTVFLA